MKNVMRILMIGFLNLQCVFAMSTDAEQKTRIAIESEISKRHPESSDSFWMSLAPDADQVLLQMLQDSNRGMYAKIRLVEGLGFFPSLVVKNYLLEQSKLTANQVLRKRMTLSLLQIEAQEVRGQGMRGASQAVRVLPNRPVRAKHPSLNKIIK